MTFSVTPCLRGLSRCVVAAAVIATTTTVAAQDRTALPAESLGVSSSALRQFLADYEQWTRARAADEAARRRDLLQQLLYIASGNLTAGERAQADAVERELRAALDAAGAAQSTDAEKANVKLVNDFIAAFSSRDMSKVLPFLADDCVYRINETSPPVTGHEGVRMRLASFVEMSDKVQWDILDTYARGPMVINHRIDRFISTTRPLTWEGVGVFFVKDGKIQEWFDYTIRVTR